MRLNRLLATAALVAVVSAPGASAEQPSADVAVHLGAVGTMLIATVHYSVSVTNNGPDPLTSATVVVHVDPRAGFLSSSSPCVFDRTTATVTCPFGALARGATATDDATVYFSVRKPSSVDATATRTSSTPTDPDSGNDSDSHHCFWDSYVEVGMPPGRMWC